MHVTLCRHLSLCIAYHQAVQAPEWARLPISHLKTNTPYFPRGDMPLRLPAAAEPGAEVVPLENAAHSFV